MKALKFIFYLMISIPSISSAATENADLPILCKYGVLTEVYAAKAAKFKSNGSINSYHKARDRALDSGAELGYPDNGVDMMIEAGLTDVAKKDSITQRLANLSDDDMVLSPLVQDCLSTPENYIRNYQH
ncbi:Uncharacterised protein [Serratia quinivorans]|uniref:hypothetical protein n=1 Tax=Serratia quinivorans TaxID=137545 RepID=UPI00217ACF8D|nr:hypothetical protein [Serratia quinivorans]CAI1824330.1 Uncharacterised protein [Serratia quinivorans]